MGCYECHYNQQPHIYLSPRSQNSIGHRCYYGQTHRVKINPNFYQHYGQRSQYLLLISYCLRANRKRLDWFFEERHPIYWRYFISSRMKSLRGIYILGVVNLLDVSETNFMKFEYITPNFVSPWELRAFLD